MTTFSVAALALMVLTAAGALVAIPVLHIAQGVFDLLLGEQHEDDLIDWDLL